jgi:hypothetical protein
MVREFGVDAAEARPEESAQALTPKTAAANSVGVKFFIPESLVLERRIGRDPACRNPSCDVRLSAPSPLKINPYPERP